VRPLRTYVGSASPNAPASTYVPSEERARKYDFMIITMRELGYSPEKILPVGKLPSQACSSLSMGQSGPCNVSPAYVSETIDAVPSGRQIQRRDYGTESVPASLSSSAAAFDDYIPYRSTMPVPSPRTDWRVIRGNIRGPLSDSDIVEQFSSLTAISSPCALVATPASFRALSDPIDANRITAQDSYRASVVNSSPVIVPSVVAVQDSYRLPAVNSSPVVVPTAVRTSPPALASATASLPPHPVVDSPFPMLARSSPASIPDARGFLSPNPRSREIQNEQVHLEGVKLANEANKFASLAKNLYYTENPEDKDKGKMPGPRKWTSEFKTLAWHLSPLSAVTFVGAVTRPYTGPAASKLQELYAPLALMHGVFWVFIRAYGGWERVRKMVPTYSDGDSWEDIIDRINRQSGALWAIC